MNRLAEGEKALAKKVELIFSIDFFKNVGKRKNFFLNSVSFLKKSHPNRVEDKTLFPYDESWIFSAIAISTVQSFLIIEYRRRFTTNRHNA